MANSALPVLLAAALAAVHVLAPRMRFLDGIPRSRWLSAAGGVSVAYVFVHLVPEIAEADEHLGRALSSSLLVLERHAYVLALLGLVVFYGLERHTLRSRARRAAELGTAERPPASSGAFGLSIASFALYNATIGYVLARAERGVQQMLLYALAMGLHFVVTDHGLREHHADRYDRVGRWILVVAVGTGALIGVSTTAPPALLMGLVAFLAGGVILNVLKEELPEARESRFGAFLAGAGGYALLLLLAS